jgi:hypothetical protein
MWRMSAILLVAAAANSQTVDGTLTDSITRAPIPDVIVTLLGQVRYNATTDDAGAFHFPEVHPGKYYLNIVKAGYVLPAARSRSFTVDADTRLSIEMDPLGGVEGRVRYPDGRPAPRATVALTGEGHNYTDDADPGGHFLIEDVVPGSYILRAAGAAGDPKAEGEIWVPTYFPATTDRAAAEPISVTNGLTVTRDVRLRSVPARRIRGVVRDETGEPAAGVSVRLENQTAVTAADGIFEFVGRDGEWRLTATRKDADVERRGAAAVVVSRHDLENIEIRLALPFSLRLLIESDRDAPAPVNALGYPMVLLSRVDALDAPQFVHTNGDSIANLYPGRYTVQVAGGVSGALYVESIHFGDMEVYGRPFEVWDGSQPIRITLRKGGASIRGSVEKPDGATVVVVDADESVTPSRVHTYPLTGPGFQVGSLRPGDYYVFAVERLTPLRLTDAVMRALLPRAEKVHLERNGASTLTLKTLPWPE